VRRKHGDVLQEHAVVLADEDEKADDIALLLGDPCLGAADDLVVVGVHGSRTSTAHAFDVGRVRLGRDVRHLRPIGHGRAAEAHHVETVPELTSEHLEWPSRLIAPEPARPPVATLV
jgi:hypothetical protein